MMRSATVLAVLVGVLIALTQAHNTMLFTEQQCATQCSDTCQCTDPQPTQLCKTGCASCLSSGAPCGTSEFLQTQEQAKKVPLVVHPMRMKEEQAGKANRDLVEADEKLISSSLMMDKDKHQIVQAEEKTAQNAQLSAGKQQQYKQSAEGRQNVEQSQQAGAERRATQAQTQTQTHVAENQEVSKQETEANSMMNRVMRTMNKVLNRLSHDEEREAKFDQALLEETAARKNMMRVINEHAHRHRMKQEHHHRHENGHGDLGRLAILKEALMRRKSGSENQNQNENALTNRERRRIFRNLVESAMDVLEEN